MIIVSDLSFARLIVLECDNDHRNVSMGRFLVILVTAIDCINPFMWVQSIAHIQTY
ncbi:hypothetical protein VCR26J2_370792 [Vibrio coralliirubri]|nr:hypothetical protein VCR1J2_200010 [Vibrio coralliirubri]CDT80033.1 hypothetical protein VCR26J2_370792 [Vibrio coralliirubri]